MPTPSTDPDDPSTARWDDALLPPGFALAWGLRGRPDTGGRPGLSVARVVGAAVEIADAEGLAAVTMAAVARRLGFTTMSLYRHVASKDELLLLMQDRVAGDPPDLSPGHGWRPALDRWATAHAAVLRAHPWVLEIPVLGPPSAPGPVAWLDRGLTALRDTRLQEDEKVQVVLLLTTYVTSMVRLGGGIEAGALARADDGPPPPTYGRLLAGVIDAERFPALTRAVDAGVFDWPDDLTEDDVRFGLERILDGVEVLVGRAERERPAQET